MYYIRLQISLNTKANVLFAAHASTTPLHMSSLSVIFPHQSWHWNSLGSCGHMFCALCIQQHFHGILKKKLAWFHQQNDILNIIRLPKSLMQHQNISRIITSHHGDSSNIFSYDCPHCCKVVKEAPVMAYQLRSLLSEARPLLSAYLANDDILPTDELPLTFFNSLQAVNPCLRHGFKACRGLRPQTPGCIPTSVLAALHPNISVGCATSQHQCWLCHT